MSQLETGVRGDLQPSQPHGNTSNYWDCNFFCLAPPTISILFFFHNFYLGSISREWMLHYLDFLLSHTHSVSRTSWSLSDSTCQQWFQISQNLSQISTLITNGKCSDDTHVRDLPKCWPIPLKTNKESLWSQRQRHAAFGHQTLWSIQCSKPWASKRT